MRRLVIVIAAVAVTIGLGGCVAVTGAPTYGAVYTDVKGSVEVVDNSVQCAKVGVAEAKGIICVAIGDASIKAAMEQGGIKKVHHVDCDVLSVLGVYAEYKTTVYGE